MLVRGGSEKGRQASKRLTGEEDPPTRTREALGLCELADVLNVAECKVEDKDLDKA